MFSTWTEWVYLIFFVLLLLYVVTRVWKRIEQRRVARGKAVSRKDESPLLADGSRARVKWLYGNGNLYIGSINAQRQFHGVGMYWERVRSDGKKNAVKLLVPRDKATLEDLFAKHCKESKAWNKLRKHALWSEFERLIFESDEPFVGSVGEFRDGAMSGYGREFTVNDQVYQGSFADGLRNGYGCRVYSSGKWGVYSGNFVDDRKHDTRATFHYGAAIDTKPAEQSLNGAVYVGGFADGKQHGSGRLTRANGAVEQQVWKRGVLEDAAH